MKGSLVAIIACPILATRTRGGRSAAVFEPSDFLISRPAQSDVVPRVRKLRKSGAVLGEVLFYARFKHFTTSFSANHLRPTGSCPRQVKFQIERIS